MYQRCMKHQNLCWLFLILLNQVKKGTLFQLSEGVFTLSASGHYLTDHVISEKTTSSVLECAQFCLKNVSVCKSINYRTRKDHVCTKNCEVNNATKSTKPDNLRINTDYNYYELLIKEEKKKQTKQPVAQVPEKSCDALYASGHTASGVYTIDPDGQGAFQVRCDMTTTPGYGWTVFQRRVDGSVDFYRNWTDYENGFGNLEGEFWLGLDKIHRLTASGPNVLRVDLESFENEKVFAKYGSFSVGKESQKYILTVGTYTGNAGDSLNFHNGMKFTTRDQDNDLAGNGRNCAKENTGAWWYNVCHHSNLNGYYYGAGTHSNSWARGVHWSSFKRFDYSLKTSEMKVREKSGTA